MKSVPSVLYPSLLSVSLLLTGCTLQQEAISSAPAGIALHGQVRGGEQPIAGATMQLWAVGATGYASPSIPLISTSVTTSATGQFTITGDYTCPSATTQVYLTATGGNPGLTQNNPQIAEMALLGSCGSLTPATFNVINELTTVAAVWPLAPFMSDYAHVGTSATNAAGLQNAFISAASLASVTVAGGPGTVPANVTAPTAELDTLANILSACVNSTGGTAGDTSPCGKLFTAATPTGGSAPTNIAAAALAIAQNPGLNIASLFGLSTAVVPFQPTLATAPNDWTVTVTYNRALSTGQENTFPAIDANGNIWVAYGTSKTGSTNAIFEFGPDLSLLSPATGFTDPSLNFPYAMAFDLTGNLWLANANTTTLSEFAPNGSFVKTVTGGGLSEPGFVAVDKSNNIWATNFGGAGGIAIGGVSEFTNAGVALSPAAGYTGGGDVQNQDSVALTPSGNAWVSGPQGLALLAPGGAKLSDPGTYGTSGNTAALDAAGNVWSNWTLSGISHLLEYHGDGSGAGNFTGGGLSGAVGGVAVDGVGHIWIPDSSVYFGTVTTHPVGSISEFANNGTPITSPNGYLPAGNGALWLAIDGSGNVWTTQPNLLFKTVGVAAPVVTPLSVATATSKLGTRP